MDFYGLSYPCKVENPTDNCLALQKNYDILYDSFFDNKKRDKLKGLFIYVKNEYINGYIERYLHSISIEENQYDSHPCLNDESYVHCQTKCTLNNSIACVASINRSFCYYRLNRIKWVTEVIDLANKDDDNIKMWSCNHYNKSGELIPKRKVWYKNGLVSFLIVFEEKYKDGKLHLLDFRSAYPVVKRGSEYKLLKEYNDYIKNI